MKISLSLAAVVLLLAAFPALAGPDNVSGAKALMADGRYSEASQVLTAITEKKDDPAAFAALAECEIRLGDLDAAESACVRALDGDGENAEYWKLLGQVFFARGDREIASGGASNAIKSYFADAEVKYRRALERNPADPDLHWMLGWAKELQEYPEEASELYRKQIELYPKNPGGYRRLGAQLASRANSTGGGLTPEANGIRDEAISLFDKGVEKAGPDAEILYFKGLALEWRKQRDEARKCYAAAVRADPEFYKAWKRLSEIGASGDDLLALAREVQKKSPTSPTAGSWAGYYLICKGEVDEALAMLMPLLEKWRENYAVYLQAFAAADAVLKKDAAKGLAALEKIDAYYPFSGSAANNLGLYHRDATKNYKESLKWYLRAVEKEPQSQDLLNDTGLIYLFNTGEPKKSLPLFERVLSLVEDDGQAPERGYWDALENLCKYYWEVEHDAEKVVRYADMRYEETNGVQPYNLSGVAREWKAKALKELGR